MSDSEVLGVSWKDVLLRYAGLAEDEYGQFVSLEDMSDEEFLEWCKLLQGVQNKNSDFFQDILKDVKLEAARRHAKETGQLSQNLG